MEYTHQIEFKRHFPTEESETDIGRFISRIKPWILFLLIVVVYMLIISLGAMFGHQKLLNGIKEPETAIEATVGSVLGLLAFILGFTFSLTWTRFANRNRMVIGHAKAIEVCYLRAGLVTEKQKLNVRRLLKEYTEILLGIQTGADREMSLVRIDEIHRLIWNETTSLAKEDIDSELRSLFIGSVNDMIGLSLERKIVTMFLRVPNAIWRSLFFLAAIGMLAFGYQAGIFGISRLFQLVLLPIAFALVMVLIADLNSQDLRRRFKVTQRPLMEVLALMETDIS
jgi:hypothetical protein